MNNDCLIVGASFAGLACAIALARGGSRVIHQRKRPAVQAMEAFLDKIAPILDLRNTRPASVRAGMIPCGGVVSPFAARRVLLTGDAAGMVSPVTAGGIHNALKNGVAAGYAISDYLSGKREDPSTWFVRSYPRFRMKRALRLLFDTFQSDTLFNLCLRTRAVRAAASGVYFHHKGVFDPELPAPNPRPDHSRC
jgi:digeranylgeranylglycerophospholipid reductase